MDRRLLFDSRLLEATIKRLCQQLIEVHETFEQTVLMGLQPRGIYLAERIKKELESLLNKTVHLGYLDATFHRDDFRRRKQPIAPSHTHIPFTIENQNVVLIDDVLYTGRTVRAALDAMNTFGRPSNVELLVLIDRMYSRHIPIQPTYIGRKVNTMESQKIMVELGETGQEDNIWLSDKG